MKNLLVLPFAMLLLSHWLTAQNPEIDSLKILLTTAGPNDKALVLNELAWHYKSIDTDSSRYFARNSLVASISQNSDTLLALSYNSLANAFEAGGDLDSAEFYYKSSLQIKKRLNDSLGVADSYNNLGIVADLKSNYEASLDFYFNALKLYESVGGQPFKEAMVMGNIGIVFKKQEEYEQVLGYYKRALSIYEEQQSAFGIAVTKGNIGSLYIQMGLFEESLNYSSAAQEGYRALGYARYEPYIIHNIALAQDSLGNFAIAQVSYDQAIGMHRQFNNAYELASCYINLAGNQLEQRNYMRALTSADSALYFASLAQSAEFEIQALRVRAQCNAGRQNFEQAYADLTRYQKGRDSLYQEEKAKAIFELETQYETEKKERQIALQNAEIARQDLVIQRDKILLYGGLVILILAGSFAFLYVNKLKWKEAKKREEERSRAKEDQMTAVISSQEQERNRFAQDIHDGFGQLISVLKLNLGAIQKPGSDKQKIFVAAAEVIDQMYQELRNICFNLMPQTLIKQGLPAALREFGFRINSSGLVSAEVHDFGMEDRLEDIQEISLYRITQEVVNNILKYANARRISIQLTADQEEVTLMIEDDGYGFDPEVLKAGQGNGWKNLNTRANFILGEFSFDSSPGRKGSTFILNAPLQINRHKLEMQI